MSYSNPRVEALIDRSPDHGLTEDDFVDLALAAADQAMVDVEAQDKIRQLIECSRARRTAKRS